MGDIIGIVLGYFWDIEWMMKQQKWYNYYIPYIWWGNDVKCRLPSGKHTANYGKLTSLIAQSTTSMAQLLG